MSSGSGWEPRPAPEADLLLTAGTRLVAILDHLPALVAYWTSDLRNVFANEAYSEWFGKSPAQIRGMDCEELLGHRLFALNRPYIEAVLRGESQTFERAMVDAAGEARYVQTSYTPHLVDGVVTGFFALSTDITARVKDEAALGETYRRLADEERSRLEAALHATVLQRLFAVSLELEAAVQVIAADPSGHIEAAIDGISLAIEELRMAVAREKPAPAEPA